MKRLIKKSSENKKVVKEIFYDDVNQLKRDGVEITINGTNLWDLNFDEAYKMLKDNNMIDGDKVIIPVGLELTDRIQHPVGPAEYVFNNGLIKVPLSFSNPTDENEHIA
jgi:hypothetical protein